MYRKHIRESQNQTSKFVIKSRFVEHIANLPAVFMAWNLAAGAYKGLKSSNRILNQSLGFAEGAVLFVTKTAEPVVRKFEPQLRVVDDLALLGMENIESVVPVLTSQPGKLINYTRRRYNEMIESGLQRYDDVKQTAVVTAKGVSLVSVEKSSEFFNTPSGQLVLMALNTVFDAYEMYLDHILPPLGDERPELAFGDRSRPPVFQRADILTERFKERFYKHLLLHLQNVRLRGKLTLAKYCNNNVVNF